MTNVTSSGTKSALADPLRARCPAEAPSIRTARRTLSAYLEGRVSSDLVQRALLVASELLTNALEASGGTGDIELTAVERDGMLTLTVENACVAGPEIVRAFSTVTMPAAVAERGRGLPLVASVATRLSITFERGAEFIGADVK